LQFNTRKTTRQNTLGADLQSQLGAVTLTTTAWFGTRSVIQFQAIPVATQAAANSPGGVIQFDRRFGGADVRAALPTGPLLTTVGLDVERLNEDRRGYNNFLGTPAAPTNLGEQGAQRRDETNTVQSVDPYVQAEMDLGTSWRLFAGVRHSQVKFKSADHYIVGTNGDDSGDISYSSTNPTAGVTLKITPQLATYLSYGRGFETPTLNELAYRPDGSAGLNTALGAARSNNVEWGLKGAPADGLRYAIAAFSTRTKNDIVVRTNAGGRSAYGNVANTRRDGLEASLEAKIASRWAVTASAARINARFGDAFLTCAAAPCTTPNLPVAAGNKLPGVPATTAFVELRWRTPANTAALEARAQSKLFVDDRNTDRAGGYAVFGLSAAHTFNVGATKPRLFARVDNLLDRRYVGSVIVNEANSRYFEPATGRTWLVGVDWQL
jgi:iron complex outermembrane receptor protein